MGQLLRQRDTAREGPPGAAPLEPLQFWKVFDARERLHCAGGLGELLELRCCSVSEADVGYGRALDSKKLKPWELIFTEGKLASDVRAVF